MIKSMIGNFAGICFTAVLLVVACGGCGSPRGELFPPREQHLVWPEPPEKPRIEYVGSLSGEADLKKEIAFFEGVGQFIFGKKDKGVLVAPYAVVVEDGKVLYVSDVSGAVVHIFNLENRNYKQFFEISENERLLNPVGLAIVDNSVFVVDSVLQKVCVFDLGGNFLFSFGKDRLKRPTGITYWPAEQKVYITDTARHTIDLFDPKGNFIEQIGQRGSGPGSFNFPTHLFIDSKGLLYVSDTLNYRIQVFTAAGKFIREFGVQGDRPGNFAHPCGIVVDNFENVYVTDRQFENIQIFNKDDQILMAWGHEGNKEGQFWLPAGICIDEQNRIYIADSFNSRIQVFDLLEGGEK
ncbi:MAG: 6-bladed beta-propeller [Phycisphaerae bacterium]|nr:6-bladed beta-propeller [Phycisphaerae bacterium]